MLTKEDIDTWVKELEVAETQVTEAIAEALMLSWIHWDDISRMDHDWMKAIYPSPLAAVSFGMGNCGCCRLFASCDRCPVHKTSIYTSEQADCCGGTWRMFHEAWKKYRDMPTDAMLQVMRTAAQDVRNFVWSLIDGR